VTLLYAKEKAGNKQNSFYYVSMAASYLATMMLNYPLATGVLNPAIGAAIVT
jgi:hypothetical protein